MRATGVTDRRKKLWRKAAVLDACGSSNRRVTDDARPPLSLRTVLRSLNCSPRLCSSSALWLLSSLRRHAISPRRLVLCDVCRLSSRAVCSPLSSEVIRLELRVALFAAAKRCSHSSAKLAELIQPRRCASARLARSVGSRSRVSSVLITSADHSAHSSRLTHRRRHVFADKSRSVEQEAISERAVVSHVKSID